MKDEEEERGRLLPAVCPGKSPGSHADTIATARVASLISTLNALKDLSRETLLHRYCTALSQHTLDWHMSDVLCESSIGHRFPQKTSTRIKTINKKIVRVILKLLFMSNFFIDVLQRDII